MKLFSKPIKKIAAIFLLQTTLFLSLGGTALANTQDIEDTTQTAGSLINVLTLEANSPYLFAAFTNQSAQGLVNNQLAPIEANAEVKAFIHQDSFMVPLRFLSDTFPIQVDYDTTNRMITVKNEQNTYHFWSDKNTYDMNGQAITITGASPTIAQDRLFVPLRLMGETVLGCNVAWEDKVALIYDKNLTYTKGNVQTIKNQLLQQPFGIDGTQKMDYDAMMSHLQTIASKYPDVIKIETAGKSFEGRDIPVVYLGKGDRYLYMDATAHARENIASNYAVQLIANYADCYMTNQTLGGYRVKNTLDQFTFVMIPMVNPDGVNIALHGFDAAKDPAAVKAMQQKGKNANYWKATANGVDINGNFPDNWYKAKAKSKTLGPASEGYMGDGPASEPETQMMMEIAQKHPFEAYLSFHIAGEVIYYSDNNSSTETNALASALATKVSAACGYTLHTTTGSSGFCNWVRSELAKPAFTVELYPLQHTYPFDYSKFDELLWSRAKTIPLATAAFFLQ